MRRRKLAKHGRKKRGSTTGKRVYGFAIIGRSSSPITPRLENDQLSTIMNN